MSTVTDRPVVREARMIPLSRLHLRPDFNPRTTRDTDEHRELVASLQLKGVLQSLLVSPHPEKPGEYLVTDGERRYLAAIDASLMEVPCVVDVPDPETGGLDDALIANMLRSDLTALEEARAFRRLLDAGLTVKGVCERLSRSPKYVRERLQVLELPEAMQEAVGRGAVPLGAVAALARLAEIHTKLPTVAVAKVTTRPDGRGFYQPTWRDLVDDPIASVLARGYKFELPQGVYEGFSPIAVSQFTLSKEARTELDEYLATVQAAAEEVRIEFTKTLIERASALRAAFVSEKDNSRVLIVGQNVADDLAAEAIGRLLREAQQHEAAARAREQQRAAQSATGAGKSAQEQAHRAAEREKAKQERAHALVHNEALGVAVLASMTKVPLDVRVLKILAAINFQELGRLAARGARYCLPYDYWKTSRRLESGDMKIEMVGPLLCEAAARTWLEGAKGQPGYAGRLLALVVMARFADERAVAPSRRSGYHLSAGDELPWSDETMSLVDEIAATLLPQKLTADVLAQARKDRAAKARAKAEREKAQATVTAALQNPDALTAKQRTDALAAVRRLYHPWQDAYGEAMKKLQRPKTRRKRTKRTTRRPAAAAA